MTTDRANVTTTKAVEKADAEKRGGYYHCDDKTHAKIAKYVSEQECK